MNAHSTADLAAQDPATDTADATGWTEGPSATILNAAKLAAARVAPLWPLQNFVAVNPFLGLSDRRFEDAANLLAQVGDARLTMPRAFYADALAAGRIGDDDLAEAARMVTGEPPQPADIAALKAAAKRSPETPTVTFPTVADIASEMTGTDWSGLAVERISVWAAGHFDLGQSSWKMPWRSSAPFVSWRSFASLDRTPEIAGLPSFRSTVDSLPDCPVAAICAAVAILGVPRDRLEPYFHRLLLSIAGWSGHARYLDWQADLDGRTSGVLIDLLAVRLGWEVAVLKACARDGASVAAAWKSACLAMPADAPGDTERTADLILHGAYEMAWQRAFLERLPSERAPIATTGCRAKVQAAFCIDVRSEVFRRALEAQDSGIETIGFAGFFGFPVEYVKAGEDHGTARCPVLLKPSVIVGERADGAATTAGRLSGPDRNWVQRLKGGIQRFRSGPVGPFGFVETLGLGYLGWLLADSVAAWRSGAKPHAERAVRSDASPQIMGLSVEARIDLAAGALRGMSLTDGFARVVVLIGHGSTSTNNPYASGLHCGACGGHNGEINARIAAATLNDPAVQQGLAERGIVIPEDTVFLAGLHDTTTDRVTLFDADGAPVSHRDDVDAVSDWLAAAGALARAERAASLGISPDRSPLGSVVARGRDWSQVRPEWGLAGCTAFIAAPRTRTAGRDLEGRAFLHSYDWRSDPDFSVLELILTAPLVVASWINLQYYASTVDNRHFGSGNKTLHNVTGLLGVVEGNSGDLRTGLPWQSLQDGMRLAHDPLRLSAVVEAPTEAIDAVLERHEHVRQLVENGWIHLFALTGAGTMRRQPGRAAWTMVPILQSFPMAA